MPAPSLAVPMFFCISWLNNRFPLLKGLKWVTPTTPDSWPSIHFLGHTSKIVEWSPALFASWWGILCAAFRPDKQCCEPLDTSSTSTRLQQLLLMNRLGSRIWKWWELGIDWASLLCSPLCLTMSSIRMICYMDPFWWSRKLEPNTVGCCLVRHKIDYFWEECCHVSYPHWPRPPSIQRGNHLSRLQVLNRLSLHGTFIDF